MHSSKNGNPTSVASPGGLKFGVWVSASRPKTWAASVCPVLLGCALAMQSGPLSWGLAVCSLLFSLLIQIGTNFANDYYDYVNGVDQLRTVGPKRAVASGWVTPSSMRSAMGLSFGLALLVALPLTTAFGLWSLPVVVSSVAFGILYTGGPRPFGYLGLGELFVFIYFGPVAMLGTYVVQGRPFSWDIALLSGMPGLLSCAILTANNLRDELTDRAAEKRTLVVRFGKRFGCAELTLFVAVAMLAPLGCSFFWHLLALPLGARIVYKTWTHRTAQQAAPLLPQCAALLALSTLLLCLECLM